MLKVSLFTLVATTAVLAYLIVPAKPQDVRLYQELVKSSNPEKEAPPLSYSQQSRSGVQKHIWYQDTTPLYICIESAESELFFFRQGNQIEVMEQLGAVTCLMQEELYYDQGKPKQRVRYFEAKQANYNYNTHFFAAEEVTLHKFQIEGHQIPTIPPPSPPLMKATAKRIEFSLRGEKLDFTAYHMKANLNNESFL